MTIVERAAYLKGLVEGLGVTPDSKDGKLWRAVTELLTDMAHQIEDLQTGSLDMADAMDEICEELAYLEELSLGLDEDDEDDAEDYDEESDESEDDADELFEPVVPLYDGDEGDESEENDDEELSYDGVLYDVTCPSCGREITFDEETLELGSITCPDCGETLEFDLGGEEE